MKAMAQMIIAKQEAEIAQFQAFLAGHPAHAPAVPAFNMLQMMNMTQMMQAVDLRRLTVSDLTLPSSWSITTRRPLRTRMRCSNTAGKMRPGLAEQIIADQKMEIKELQEWLLANKKY
ncbi:DUF305 domain-containing protein [Hymenobacter radiodurans]|uniref:DUF305 domain-containing protein n=1 Tax=Hymenobacter radiodurans TaxID=2496028 RepID=UPI001058A567|nr:DUF305 domain-containing protein [Hymenobacter radiodurans]